MNINALCSSSGILSCGIIAVTHFIRQKRMDLKDLGAFIAAFLSGLNIPAALFLCAYGIFPDPPSVATKLQGLEKFVTLAGLILLLISLISIINLWNKAFEISPPDA